MEAAFSQRFLFDSRKYILKENGLQIFSSGISNSTQVFVKFEQLGFNKTFYEKKNKFWIIGMVIFGFYLIAGLAQYNKFVQQGHEGNIIAFAILFVGSIIGYLMTNSKRCILSNFENTCRIDFLTDPDTDMPLQDFLVNAKIKRDAYLIGNYGHVNKNLPYNVQYGQFLWLKNNGVYSDDAYKQKMHELDQALSTGNKVIGFGTTDL